MAFGKKELEEIAKKLAEQGALQEKLNNSLSEYTEGLKKVAEIQANIKHISEQQAIIKEKEQANTERLAKLLKDRHKGTAAEIVERQKEIKILILKLKLQRQSVAHAEEALGLLKKENQQYVEALGNVNKLNMALKASNQALSAVPGLIQKGYGKLKSLGLFDVDKAIRMAGVEMGKVVSVGSSFATDLELASNETFSMGVHMKDLAKIQADYSTGLGRNVMLSQEGFEAISSIAKGTMLGVEGATALVGEMDKFNISVERSGEIIEQTVNMSEKMGLNSTKVLKTLENSLKMANKYHFKGGVEGMIKMAATAAKFNVSMQTTAGLADKLFDIEGAVEMSAQLNTMGGEWSKLGDPMKLMYQARNDMEGLQQSLIDATSGMADFNKETGEFEFSGLELHRMRELEKITGVSAEEMAEMAKQKAKFAKIQGELGFSVAGDPEMKEFIENSSVFNKNTKQFELKLSGIEGAIPVKELNETHKSMMIADAKSLKERAQNSQTFDEQLVNMIEQLKTLFLPILIGLNKSLPAITKGFQELMKSGLAEKIKEGAKKIGEIVGKALTFLSSFPAEMIVAFGGLMLALKGLQWFASGRMLGMGFNSVASVGGGIGGGGIGPSKGGLSRGMKIGGGLMIGGMAMDYGRGMIEDQDSAGGKAMGIAGGAMTGAGTGAMIGSIIPGIGTLVGGIIGGLIGGVSSAVTELGGDSSGIPASGNAALNDGVVMDGKVTPFNKKDDVLKFQKTGGAIDKAVATGAGTTTSKSNSNIGGTTNIHISFDELKVTSDGSSGKIDLSTDSAFIRELATKIKESLSQTANGGVLNPNPST